MSLTGIIESPFPKRNTMYRAEVVNDVDPDGLNRIQVRIYSLHGKKDDPKGFIPDEYLPWASPGMMKGGSGSGTSDVPEIGNTVFVSYEDGDWNTLIYFGVAPSSGRDNPTQTGSKDGKMRPVRASHWDKPKEIQSNNDRMAFRSPKGTKMVAYDSDGEEQFQIADPLGQVIGLCSPMKKEATDNNRHETHDTMATQSFDKYDSLEGKASVLLKGLSGSMLKILSGGVSNITQLISNGAKRAVIHMTSGLVSSMTLGIEGSNNARIDFSDGKLSLTVGASNITLTPNAIYITSPQVFTNSSGAPQGETSSLPKEDSSDSKFWR